MASSATNKPTFHTYDNANFPEPFSTNHYPHHSHGIVSSNAITSNNNTTSNTSNGNSSLGDIAINKAAIESPFPDPLHGEYALFDLPLHPLSSYYDERLALHS